ncbi:MAG: hypothetical protein JWO46_446 [Nocardioidaceae bacterium]|nr:hypothetical protein [Nocardioidaceae bacterium]
MTSTRAYALAAPLRARLLGVVLAGGGVLLCVVVAALAATARGAIPYAVLVVLLLVVLVGFLLRRRTTVVRLDETGYRVRFVRGVGAASARWVDVADLVTADVAGARCAVLRLRDGRTTTIPVDVLAGDPQDFVRDLGARLREATGRRAPG